MKNIGEKPEKVNEIIDIGVSDDRSTMLGTMKEGDSMKEPYEPPKMVLLYLKDALETLSKSGKR